MAGHLATFSVENYKSFKSRASIELRPLTILFGYNSAGKSALLRALPFLADSLSGSNGPLEMRSEAVRGAAFRDLVCRSGDQTAVSFSLGWDTGTPRRVTYTVRDLPDRNRQVVERMLIEGAGSEALTLEWDIDRVGGSYDQYLPSDGERKFAPVKLKFNGLLPTIVDSKNTDPAVVGWLLLLEARMRPLAHEITWLKALRDVPPRWEVQRPPPPKLKPSGEGALQLLAADAAAGGEAVLAVSSWYEAATSHTLQIQRGSFQSEELLAVTLSPKGRAAGAAIADTGEGMAQVFPVVVYLALAKGQEASAERTLVVEHPELHLHPAAHGHLAALFCDVARGPNTTSIVETHSENFILRVQLEIAEGRLSRDLVRLYWVRHLDGEAVAEVIDFDDLGRPEGDNWPPGMFSENVEQARQLAKVRQEKSRPSHEDSP